MEGKYYGTQSIWRLRRPEHAAADASGAENAAAEGAGVTCKVNGKREIVSLTIKPEAVDPEDVEMLQDMVMAAVNEALRQGEENREKTMSALAPAGMGGMF